MWLLRFSPSARAAGALSLLLLMACSDRVAEPEPADGFDCDAGWVEPTGSPYVLPFPAGRAYRMIQTYCPPNPAWGHHDTFAYDFGMPIGDTVIASRAGEVIGVREHNPDGTRQCGVGHENYVVIRHADGTAMIYAHLTTNGAFVDVGQPVDQGQPLGLSGDSGCSSGPHLHVALHRDAGDFSPASTVPVTYANAEGPLDANGGLIQAELYTAR